MLEQRFQQALFKKHLSWFPVSPQKTGHRIISLFFFTLRNISLFLGASGDKCWQYSNKKDYNEFKTHFPFPSQQQWKYTLFEERYRKKYIFGLYLIKSYFPGKSWRNLQRKVEQAGLVQPEEEKAWGRPHCSLSTWVLEGSLRAGGGSTFYTVK